MRLEGESRPQEFRWWLGSPWKAIPIEVRQTFDFLVVWGYMRISEVWTQEALGIDRMLEADEEAGNP